MGQSNNRTSIHLDKNYSQMKRKCHQWCWSEALNGSRLFKTTTPMFTFTLDRNLPRRACRSRNKNCYS